MKERPHLPSALLRRKKASAYVGSYGVYKLSTDQYRQCDTSTDYKIRSINAWLSRQDTVRFHVPLLICENRKLRSYHRRASVLKRGEIPPLSDYEYDGAARWSSTKGFLRSTVTSCAEAIRSVLKRQNIGWRKLSDRIQQPLRFFVRDHRQSLRSNRVSVVRGKRSIHFEIWGWWMDALCETPHITMG